MKCGKQIRVSSGNSPRSARVRTSPPRANVHENCRTTIGAKTLMPLLNIAAWLSRSRYFIAGLLAAHETRSATSNLSDEGIGDTFVSIRMELPAHGHAAQPKHKPDGGMRSQAGRTRLGHHVRLACAATLPASSIVGPKEGG